MAVRLRPREQQSLTRFVPGDPTAGYYNDVGVEARKLGTAADASRALERLTGDRESANPVTIAQVGLGSWLLAQSDPAWGAVAAAAAEWLALQLDELGRIPYFFGMRHTFALDPPWYSAMAQGEAVSLLVRVGLDRDEQALLDSARRAAGPLLSESSELVVRTAEGPVLQEYPTAPAAHVLNGWIFALWGLYDLSCLDAAGDGSPSRAHAAFEEGVDALARRLHLYRAWPSWSRYDLFPHPLPNVASPFYHRLHVAQLRATQLIAPRPEIEAEIARWAGSASHLATSGIGGARKAAFRLSRPRSGPFAARARA